MLLTRVRARMAGRPILAAFQLSLSVLWINFLLTSRWAGVDGSINSDKRPFYAAALALASVLSVVEWRRSAGRPMRAAAARLAAAGGLLFLLVVVFICLPP